MRIRKYKWTMLIISGIIAGIVFTGCVWPVSEAEEDNSINYKSIFIEKLNAHWKLQIPELQDGSDTKIKEVGKGTGISFDNYSSEFMTIQIVHLYLIHQSVPPKLLTQNMHVLNCGK